MLRNDNAKQQSKNITGPNLVIFVDELDRCRPTFAVQLLERIKHFFDIPNIVFVLSLDKKQIEACIKAVYGAEIDATEYLRRFFNLEFGIPHVDTESYIDSLITRFDLDPIFNERSHSKIKYDRAHFVEYMNALANAMEMPLRAIERCITRLRIVMDQTLSDQHLGSVLLALLLVLHSKKRDFYDQIINGEVSPDDVVGYLTSIKLSQQNVNILRAYLLIADLDRERSDEQIRVLMANRSQDQETNEVVTIIEKIIEMEEHHLSLVDLAKKIDLASWAK